MALLERCDAGAEVIEDRFTRVSDEAALPAAGGVIVSLSRFEAQRDVLLARGGVAESRFLSERDLTQDFEELRLLNRGGLEGAYGARQVRRRLSALRAVARLLL